MREHIHIDPELFLAAAADRVADEIHLTAKT